MVKRIQLAVFTALLAIFAFASTADAQKKVLFETFTNSFDLCPAPNTFDAQFKSTVSSKSSKIIFLNHHIANIGDPMSQYSPNSSSTDLRLADQQGATEYPIFLGAVDRTPFDQNRLSNDQGAWNSRIDERGDLDPDVRIHLVNATFDKAQRTVAADVEVTATGTMGGKVNIFYALTEDKVSFAQCSGSGAKTHNNVVRYITNGSGVPMNFSGVPGGTAVRDHFSYKFPTSQTTLNFTNMRLIAFVETTPSLSSEDYSVANAAILKMDIDTLQTPVGSLTLDESNLNGKSFNPGDVVPVSFTKENLNFIQVDFSTNNGSTWTKLDLSSKSPYNWTVPDVSTTQGKIRVFPFPENVPVATQSGTFTIIAKQHALSILHPLPTDEAVINKPFKIEWSATGVDTVKIEYSNDGGGAWTTVAPKISGTSYDWTPTGSATLQGVIRLTSVGLAEPIVVSSELFKVNSGAGNNAVAMSGVATTSPIYPNPVKIGQSAQIKLASMASTSARIELIDMLGRVASISDALRITTGDNDVTIPTAKLQAGTYVVRVVSDLGEIATSTLTVVQ